MREMPQRDPIEPVLLLLAGMMVFFTGVLFIAERFFSSDAQVFQVICGLLTGISGAFLMRIKPAPHAPEPTSSTTVSRTVSVVAPIVPTPAENDTNHA